MSWALWELAKNQTIQAKLREEILEFRQNFGDRIPSSEYEKMEYTVIFIKVFLVYCIVTICSSKMILRRYSVFTQLLREYFGYRLRIHIYPFPTLFEM